MANSSACYCLLLVVSLCGYFFSEPLIAEVESEVTKSSVGSRQVLGGSVPDTATWDVRLSRDSKISNASVVAADGKTTASKFLTRSEVIAAGKTRTNIFFLIDTSDSRRRSDDIAASKAMVAQLLGQAQSHQHFGLGILGESLHVVCKTSTPVAEISLALTKPDNFPDQKNTYLYRSLVGAIQELPEAGDDRSAIVVFSDGIAEDGGEVAYTLQDVLGHCAKKDVAIVTVALQRLPEFEKEALQFNALSSATKAPSLHLKSPSYRIGGDVQERFLKHLDSGGWVQAATTDVSEGMTLHLSSLGQEFTSKLVSNSLTPQVADPKTEKDPAAKNDLPPGGATAGGEARKEGAGSASNNADPSASVGASKEKLYFGLKLNHLLIAGGGGVLFLVLLIALASYFLRGKRQAEESEYAAPDIPPAPPARRREAGAFLEDVRNSANIYPILSSALRIGRGGDNDIQLSNDSVSKHHAELIKTSDGRFLVQDLASGNGVFLNGNRIDSGEIKDGDVIEIGEVHLRFINKLRLPETSES